MSYTQDLIQKKKSALVAAEKAYQLAIQKRAQELGKLCLEAGLGDYDNTLLKEQLSRLAKGLPKSSPKAS